MYVFKIYTNYKSSYLISSLRSVTASGCVSGVCSGLVWGTAPLFDGKNGCGDIAVAAAIGLLIRMPLEDPSAETYKLHRKKLKIHLLYLYIFKFK